MIVAENIKVFITEKQEIIGNLTAEKRQVFEKIYETIERKAHHYRQLENALDNDLIPVSELNETHTNLNAIKKDIEQLETDLKVLLSGKGEKREALDPVLVNAGYLSRQGAVIIRPAGDKNYTLPEKRKSIVNF